MSEVLKVSYSAALSNEVFLAGEKSVSGTSCVTASKTVPISTTNLIVDIPDTTGVIGALIQTDYAVTGEIRGSLLSKGFTLLDGQSMGWDDTHICANPFTALGNLTGIALTNASATYTPTVQFRFLI